MKLNRKLVMVLALVLSLALATGGTLAYLTDTDKDVNVMTLGSVKIVQNEQMRDENGDLVPFENNQPAYPAVKLEAGQWTTLDVNGHEVKLREDVENAIDKIVSVTNTGKSDAYVRTLVAIESPAEHYMMEAPIYWKVNDAFSTSRIPVGGFMLDGHAYTVLCFTYPEALAAGETSIPSLLQVYLGSEATNEDVEALGDTWDILVLSQAVQTAGFANAETALNTAFGEVTTANIVKWMGETAVGSPGDKNNTNNPPVFFTGDPAELHDMLANATDAGSGNVTIELTESYDLTGYDWKPIKVDGYHGADIVTINGNGNVIKGLNAPIFSGGFAGGSGIVIKDLTIRDSEIVSTSTQGSGAFIECADSMDEITLTNCHLINSTMEGSRTGGLLGWTAGYDNPNDGPVDAFVTIKNCSVVNCTITGKGSVGGIIGHSGGNAATFTTVSDCIVKDCTLISYDDSYRVGIVMGTANIGENTISNITESGNTVKQINGSTEIARPDGQSALYGRFVPGSTGKLTIDGVAIN